MSVLNAEFAWPGGDRPSNPNFQHALSGTDTFVQMIKQALASSFSPVLEPDVRLRALRMPDGPVGRYLLTSSGKSWFIRVSSRWGNPELEQSITRFLTNQGVHVTVLLVAGRPLPWNGQVLRVDVRPMIEGRHYNGSEDDLRRLAATLAACHRALSHFSRADAVRAATAARNRRLEKICHRMDAALKRGDFRVFAERASWAAEHRDCLLELTKEFEPRLDQDPHAQCLHGEIHLGNVVFCSTNGSAALLDFEESVHVFAPPAWDLAFFVQRFCLYDDPPRAVGLQRLSIVANAYGRPLPILAKMMRQGAWFSIVTILDMRISLGIVTPVSEYDKFVRLARQARALEGVF